MRGVEGESPRVVTYRDEYRGEFEALNREWIQRWFRVEPADEEGFRDPYATYVASGGEILFVVVGDRVLGTCALRRAGGDVYELCKMAVAPAARGRGLGDLLMRAVLEAARSRGARRLFLLSNTVLAPAIRLYEKHGFVTTRRGPHLEYDRADIEMALDLEPPAADPAV